MMPLTWNERRGLRRCKLPKDFLRDRVSTSHLTVQPGDISIDKRTEASHSFIPCDHRQTSNINRELPKRCWLNKNIGVYASPVRADNSAPTDYFKTTEATSQALPSVSRVQPTSSVSTIPTQHSCTLPRCLPTPKSVRNGSGRVKSKATLLSSTSSTRISRISIPWRWHGEDVERGRH